MIEVNVRIVLDEGKASPLELALLETLGGKATPAAAEPTEEAPATPRPAPAKAPAKAKAAPKAKAPEPEPEPETEEPAPEPEVPEETAPEPEPEVKGGAKPTVADALARAQQLVAAKQTKRIREALEPLGVARVGQLKPSQVAAFLAAVED